MYKVKPIRFKEWGGKTRYSTKSIKLQLLEKMQINIKKENELMSF